MLVGYSRVAPKFVSTSDRYVSLSLLLPTVRIGNRLRGEAGH